MVNGNESIEKMSEAFMQAAENGDLDGVQLSIDAGVDFYQLTNSEGQTAFQVAAKNGHVAVMKLLLTAEKVEARKVKEAKKKKEAVAKKEVAEDEIAGTEKIKNTVKKGSKKQFGISHQDNSDNTALMLAAKMGHVEVVDFLIHNWADVKLKNNNDETALSLAEGNSTIKELISTVINRIELDEAARKGNREKIKELVNKGVNFSEWSRDGETPFLIAAKNHQLPVMELLYEIWKDNKNKNKNKNPFSFINQASFSGRNALLCALRSYSKRSTSINRKKFNSPEAAQAAQDALIAASEANDNKLIKIIEFLVANGININYQSASGETALIIAAEKGYLDLVKFLVEEMKADIHQKVSIESKDIDGEISKIIKKGSHLKEISIKLKNKPESTALSAAVEKGRIQVVEFLVDKGALISNDTSHLLCIAAKNGHEAVVKFLLDKGADINGKDDSGETPLTYASKMGRVNVIKVLLEKGADVTLKNKTGETAVDIANHNDSVAQLFDPSKAPKKALIHSLSTLGKEDSQPLLSLFSPKNDPSQSPLANTH